ncbi:hypothetical protein TUN199_10528 [Pyrenophora tritici-repentis]|nr:hypothetical protein TUN199_10528 [Pyrenophora tritici-repentis]
MTVQEYRLQLDEHRELAIEYSGDLSKGRIQESGVEDPVPTALFLSIDQISRDHAFAADYLFLAASVGRKAISLDLLEAVSMQAREDAIRMLDKYALIFIDSSIKPYASDCKCRDRSKNGLNALQYTLMQLQFSLLASNRSFILREASLA